MRAVSSWVLQDEFGERELHEVPGRTGGDDDGSDVLCAVSAGQGGGWVCRVCAVWSGDVQGDGRRECMSTVRRWSGTDGGSDRVRWVSGGIVRGVGDGVSAVSGGDGEEHGREGSVHGVFEWYGFTGAGSGGVFGLPSRNGGTECDAVHALSRGLLQGVCGTGVLQRV